MVYIANLKRPSIRIIWRKLPDIVWRISGRIVRIFVYRICPYPILYFQASKNGHVEVVKVLLEKQEINVNQARTTDGATPLIMASQDGVLNVLLADKRVDPKFYETRKRHKLYLDDLQKTIHDSLTKLKYIEDVCFDVMRVMREQPQGRPFQVKQLDQHVLPKQLGEFFDLKANVFKNIRLACETAKELESIALGKSVLTSVDCIERLIESERKSSRPDKEDYLEQLNFFLGRAEFLQAARTDYDYHDMATDDKSAYEVTVIAAINEARRTC